MEEFISSVTGKLGIDSSTATNATSALLGLIKKEGDGSAVSDLFAKLPGASALADTGPASGGGGMMGKLGGMLGGMTGGAGGGIAALASSGLSPDKIPDFVKTFIEWAKAKVGPDTVNKVVSSVPALKSILG